MVSRAVPEKPNASAPRVSRAGIASVKPEVEHGPESIELLLENSIVAGVNELQGTRDSSSETFRTVVTACEVVADMATIGLGVTLANVIYNRLGLGVGARYSAVEIGLATVFLSVCFVLMLYKDEAYSQVDGLLRVKETERVLRASCTVMLLVLPITFFAQLNLSRWLALLTFLTVPCLLVFEKYWIHIGLRWIRERGYGVKKVVIYGAGITGRRVFSALVRSPKLGLAPVAFVDKDQALVGTTISALGYKKTRRIAEVVGEPLSPELVERLGAEHVIIAIPTLRREEFVTTARDLIRSGIGVSFIPNHNIPLDLWMDHTDIDGLLLASFRKVTRSAVYNTAKRIIDATLSGLLLILFSPLLLAITILIRKGSNGPALFKQQRVGKDGTIFYMYKFRSMYQETPPYQVSPADPSDPRITPLGKLIRRMSIDELPQLLNVLTGEMSLVGPRPEMPFIVERYRPLHQQRLLVKPGITGLWQLSADRDYHIHENIEYDLYYIRNQNFFMDISILVHTALFAMRGV
jgi:exopolysaccharide biosynthesis polyprenyl glycosylphosphotransferase